MDLTKHTQIHKLLRKDNYQPDITKYEMGVLPTVDSVLHFFQKNVQFESGYYQYVDKYILVFDYTLSAINPDQKRIKKITNRKTLSSIPEVKSNYVSLFEEMVKDVEEYIMEHNLELIKEENDDN